MLEKKWPVERGGMVVVDDDPLLERQARSVAVIRVELHEAQPIGPDETREALGNCCLSRAGAARYTDNKRP